MTSIRAIERADLPAVVELLRVNFQPWWGDAGFLTANVLDHPWADESLPSYLAVDDDGKPVGFIGAQVRRLRFDGRTIRGVCCTQLGVLPDQAAGASGALLIGRLLSGNQDLTWSDSATDTVARLWRFYGGHLDHARANDWMFVLRPMRWIRSLVGAAARRHPVKRDLSPVGGIPFHAAGPRVARRTFTPPPPDVVGEDSTIEVALESLPSITNGFRLWVDHDAGHLGHVFEQLEAASESLVRRLVRRAGRPIGWYAYVLRRGGVSRVVHIAAPEPDADAVLGELIDHARRAGSAVVTGRAEPHLMHSLKRRLALLGPARTPIFHTQQPGLAAVLGSSASLLTRLDGELLVT